MRAAAESVAVAIRTDSVLAAVPGFGVVIEDETDVEAAITDAFASLGVKVVVAVPSWRRRGQSGQLLTGDITFSVTAVECTQLNRSDDNPGYMTAQGVAQRIARILHWRSLPGLVSPLRLVDMVRVDDKPEHAVMRSTYVAEHELQ